MSKKKWTQWIYWFTLGLALVIIYKTLDSFSDILNWVSGITDLLMPFLMAILVAYILYIPSRKVERLYEKVPLKFISKNSRTLGVLSIYLVAIVLIVVIAKFVVPSMYSSIVELINNIPSYYQVAVEYLSNMPENPIVNKANIQEVFNSIQSIDIKSFINTQEISGIAAKGVMGMVNVIFNTFVTAIVSIYMLIERRQIKNFMKKLGNAVMKNNTYVKVSNYFKKTNEIFYKFLASQIMDACVVGVIMSIALSLLNVRYAILLGIMIGLFNIIPYFGAIFAVAISVIITLFTGGWQQAIIMTIVIIVLQQIDANIINPKIVGGSLKLSPILIIFAVTIGGAYFGVLGMFLAVPVIAILKIFVLDFIENKELKEKKEEYRIYNE